MAFYQHLVLKAINWGFINLHLPEEAKLFIHKQHIKTRNPKNRWSRWKLAITVSMIDFLATEIAEDY